MCMLVAATWVFVAVAGQIESLCTVAAYRYINASESEVREVDVVDVSSVSPVSVVSSVLLLSREIGRGSVAAVEGRVTVLLLLSVFFVGFNAYLRLTDVSFVVAST